MESFTSSITFFINGKKFALSEDEIDPKCTLLQFLRNFGFTGTKLGCGEGGCGACTVMLSSYNTHQGTPIHYSANACLTPVCSLDGIAVTTVEGIGGMKQGLHPVQQRIAALHGSQCGFCTPGIVMAIYTQFRANPNASPHEIEESLDGNLCRCTGYRPIIDAARSLSNAKSKPVGGCCGGGGDGGGCPCAETGADSLTSPFEHSTSEKAMQSLKSLAEEMTSRSLSEPIFPPFLTHYDRKALGLTNKNGSRWYQPLTLSQLHAIKAEFPSAKLVVGNTEVGIEMKFKALEYSTFINPTLVPELQVCRTVTLDAGPAAGSSVAGVEVGAAVTINGLRSFIEKLEEEHKSNNTLYMTRGLKAIRHMLTWFASNHIRNVACVGGNIVTASPISDLNPMLIACKAVLRVSSAAQDVRHVPMDKFFLSYRKVDLYPEEVVESVFIPFTSGYEFVLPFKQARRREDDISIVTAGMRIALQPATDSWKIGDCTLAFGGMAPTTVQAAKTSAAMVGLPWTSDSIRTIFSTLRLDLSLPATVPGGQAEYRMSLAVSFLFKAYLTITTELADSIADSAAASTTAGSAGATAINTSTSLPPAPPIDPSEMSATFNFLLQDKTYSRGEQGYYDRQGESLHRAQGNVAEVVAPSQAGEVGKPMRHKNADSQVSGESKFVNDLPLPSNAVHACLVTSARVHAKLLSIDTSPAEACPGYVAFFSAKDVTGNNKIGAVIKDEEIFATEFVTHVGAVIGVILANSHEEAVYAARKVRIEYEDLPAMVSINDAIANASFHSVEHAICNGDLEKEIAEADIHVEGEGKMGSQEHFYLETNSTVVLPIENGLLEVFSSTQAVTKTQNCCASVCGLPASKVVAKCKRMGGGFGGKETRSVFIACTAALAAHLLDRPVSINIERDVDMSISGQRHAFQFTYKAGMMKDGTLKYLQAQLYNNGGFSLDLSQPVMDRALFHCDNVYRWPALHTRGRVCKTNQPSHTAFRGFGGPQGMIVTEMVIQHLAETSKIPVDAIKQLNMYREGDRTHFGQRLEAFHVPTLWDKIQHAASVTARRVEVAEFNKTNRWRKRGICVMPTKFGINFTAKFMNQGGALVHVYADGSVLVAHGGTEMGQGLYTKVIQVAAQCFGISERFVITAETSTNTVANTSPTAASASTDLYGMAVLDACEQIQRRLAPLLAKRPELRGPDQWAALTTAAFFERIDLSAHGYYAIDADRCGYDWEKVCTDNAERGLPFNYFTMGVACCEVEIDCLTGDSHIRRADVLMDVGKSINPALDIGQIEGAFMQGYGWSTMEEMVWGDKEHPWVRPGQLFTRGPGTYKIPAFNDVPSDFRVHLSDTDNRFAVHSSKAVGEPPFFLGASAFFAIKDAINAARAEQGFSDYYQLNLPATSERIRMACADDITQLCVAEADAVGKVDTQSLPTSDQFYPKGSC